MKIPFSILPFALVSLVFEIPTVLAQGSLTPPGAPAPTMKSLDQIEARTPVDAAHTPGGFLTQFIINQPGSYYLTTNIYAVNSKRGIQIEASNVTLDLNGFSMLGDPGAYDAIYFPFTTTSNITIRGGTIARWTGGWGIYFLGQAGRFERLTLSGNANGMFIADTSIVKDCHISGSATGLQINGAGSTIVDNIFSANGGNGIFITGSRNRIEGNHITCTANLAYGIYAGATNNIIVKNFVEGRNVNYFYDSTQVIGPIINTTGIITNSNPWANISLNY